MMPCGFLFGYGFARLSGLDETTSRTVSMETGIQQGGIAAAIILNTYDEDDIGRAMSVLVSFAMASLGYGALFAGLFRYVPVTDGSKPPTGDDGDGGLYDIPVGKATDNEKQKQKKTEFSEIAPGGEGGFDI
jgi:Na+/citrate or Na+/malate symporter